MDRSVKIPIPQKPGFKAIAKVEGAEVVVTYEPNLPAEFVKNKRLEVLGYREASPGELYLCPSAEGWSLCKQGSFLPSFGLYWIVKVVDGYELVDRGPASFIRPVQPVVEHCTFEWRKAYPSDFIFDSGQIIRCIEETTAWCPVYNPAVTFVPKQGGGFEARLVPEQVMLAWLNANLKANTGSVLWSVKPSKHARAPLWRMSDNQEDMLNGLHCTVCSLVANPLGFPKEECPNIVFVRNSTSWAIHEN